MPELGGRRKPRPDSHNTAWRNEAFRGYADYMETPEFRAGIERLLQLARGKRTAIMCSEAVWWRCHRSLIADEWSPATSHPLIALAPREEIAIAPFISADWPCSPLAPSPPLISLSVTVLKI